jgi:putative tricarboxylic transport membrane protein
MADARRFDPAGVAIAVALAVLAAVIWWDAGNLGTASAYGMGPKTVPQVIAAGLGLLAVANLVTALRGSRPGRELPQREPIDLKPILLIVGGLAALIALIGLGGGFIAATTILFATTAAAFGRRAVLADLAIGFVLSVSVYLLFSRLLSLSLPMGPLERLI